MKITVRVKSGVKIDKSPTRYGKKFVRIPSKISEIKRIIILAVMLLPSI